MEADEAHTAGLRKSTFSAYRKALEGRGRGTLGKYVREETH